MDRRFLPTSRGPARRARLLPGALAGGLLIACSTPAPPRTTGAFPPTGDLQVLFVRTDFSDDRAWEEIQAAALSFHGPFRADVLPVDDRRFDGLTVERLVALVPEGQEPFHAFLVDREALSRPDRPVLVVNLFEPRGRSFRVVPAQLWSVQANLSLANMDWEEFADAVDDDGVFRGFER